MIDGVISMERNVRSIAKAISWRVVATSTTIILVLIFTGNIVISAGVGAFELLSKTVIYYIHERIWNRLSFGRETPTYEKE